MRTFLIVLSAIITISSAIPYLIGIIQGKTKPRVVSWFTWTVLTGIACAASFADHQYPAAILMLCATLETAAIVVLGFKHGDRKFEKLDILCQAGALIGLILWFTLDSPAIAVLVMIAIDLIGAIPTFKHSWQKPSEEIWLTFALAGLGGGLTVLIAHEWKVTAIAYPLYILLVNIVTTTILFASPHRRAIREPAELREL